MNYERNKLYFNPVSSGLGCFLIIVGFFLMTVGIGLVLIPIGIVLIVSAKSKKSKQSKISGAEIDRDCADYLSRNLKSMALQKLGIAEDRAWKITPIRIDGYYYEDILGTSKKGEVCYKKSGDGKWRTSNYNAAMFFFSQDQVFCYELKFSLLEDKKQEKIEKFSYRDIVSVSMETCVADTGSAGEDHLSWTKRLDKSPESLRPLLILFRIIFLPFIIKSIRQEQAQARKQMKRGNVKDLNFESFKLTTVGGTLMQVAIFVVYAAKRAIEDMENLIRSKR